MPELPRLSSIVLPEDHPLRRDLLLPEEERGPDYEARYDRRTLVYDAFHLPEAGLVRLVCPNLLNLAGALMRAEIALDGRPIGKRRLRRFSRHDVLDLPASGCPDRLALSLDGWGEEVVVGRVETMFDGLDCLVTLSRNNELDWIRDWAGYHAREHRANAVLFFDNGSTEYGAADVAETLAAVPGLRAVGVVPVDLPFGALGKGKRRHDSLFLQAGMLNIARQRFLARARAVLQCDVDELVTGPPVFDATVARWSGYLMIPGVWRYAAVAPGETPRHRDHVLRREPEAASPPKYCVVPSGRVGRRAWKTHRVEGIWFSRLHRSREHVYLHCHGLSTRWKSTHSRATLPDARRDPVAERVLERGFGAGSASPDSAGPRGRGET